MSDFSQPKYPHFEPRPDGGYNAFVTAGRSPKVNAALLREAVQMIATWGGVVYLTPGLYRDKRPIELPAGIEIRGPIELPIEIRG